LTIRIRLRYQQSFHSDIDDSFASLYTTREGTVMLEHHLIHLQEPDEVRAFLFVFFIGFRTKVSCKERERVRDAGRERKNQGTAQQGIISE